MIQKTFKIYSSSAGSGKTYTLTKEYLKLVISNPGNFRHILAVTFTNKATEEMKSRIIEKLADLKEGESSPLADELMKVSGLKPDELKSRAGKVLEAILHDYSRFAVSTIDSFFQKVLRAFAYESLQKSAFSIELDQEKVLEDITNRVLMEAGSNEALTNWLIQFAESKVEEQKSWDFREDIKQLAREIFKEEFKTFEDTMGSKLEDKTFVPEFLKQVREVKSGFENTMEHIALEAIETMDRFGVTASNFKQGARGPGDYFNKILKKNFEPNSYVNSAYDNEEEWLKKDATAAARSAVGSGLSLSLNAAVNYYRENVHRYNTALQILKFIYTFGILSDITRKLQEYRDDNDVLLISDVARFLNEIIGENDAPYIYEKVGASYKHFLIDEFQDTSSFQWTNFRPLIENSLADGNFNLIVGDVKQSIYRWRGGDWTLLLNKVTEDIPAYYSERTSLTENWRSKKNIIDFNNAIFKIAPSVIQDYILKKIEDARISNIQIYNYLINNVGQLLKAYEDAYQHLPTGKSEEKLKGGYVNMTFLDQRLRDEVTGITTNWKEAVKERIPSLLEELQDRGYCLKDIALLVRTKSEGSEIAKVLLDYKASEKAKSGYNYEVISSESLYLSNSSSVRLIINALQYMRNPADKIAAVYMVQEYRVYLASVEGHKPTMNEVFGLQEHLSLEESSSFTYLKHFLPASFTDNIAYLSKLPLYEMIEGLIMAFRLNEQKDEFAFLQNFQDAVLGYSRTEKTDLSSFLNWWNKKGHMQSVLVPENQDAMRILTVHKSKGLQYKTVIMPFCSWHLDHNAMLTNIIWAEANEAPFNQVSKIPIRYGDKLGNTLYSKDYFVEKVQAHMDNLNTLYVAFTRAEENLYIFAPKPEREEYNDTVAGLLYYIANNRKPILFEQETKRYEDLSVCWNPEAKIFELGEPMQQSANIKNTSDSNQFKIENYFSSSWRSKLAIRPQAKDFFVKSSGTTDKINYSLLAHTILSCIKTSADVDKELEKVFYLGLVNEDESKTLRALVKDLLSNPEIAVWFGPGWQVKTEASLLSSSGNICKPDRVLINDTRAVVLDFKINIEEQKHHKQIKEYVWVLRHMGYKQVDGYLLNIEQKVINKVI